MKPRLGDRIKGTEIGKKTPRKYQWSACCDCAREKWIMLKNGKPQSPRCASCAAKFNTPQRVKSGKNHWHWRGGRCIMSSGYIEIWLDPSNPYFSMTGKDGYVYEHRLVMAQHLKRCLESWEIVHHKNHDKSDNRIENLEILDKKTHSFNHMDIKSLCKQIEKLRIENTSLRNALAKK